MRYFARFFFERSKLYPIVCMDARREADSVLVIIEDDVVILKKPETQEPIRVLGIRLYAKFNLIARILWRSTHAEYIVIKSDEIRD